MNMKPKKPLPQPNAQIDLSEAETMTCEDCGNAVFIPAFFLKRLSPIVSPTGQEALEFIEAGANRIGTSMGVEILL